jgi:hypothetical protein
MLSQPAVCAHCGAALARDHVGAALCSPCAAAANAGAVDIAVLPADRLARVVAGVLLLYSGLRPGRRVPVRRILAQSGVSAEAWEIHHSVETLRARGFVIDAVERRRGYRFIDFALVPLTRGFCRRRRASSHQIPLV